MREIKFKATIQRMGNNSNEKPRFFIYITPAVNLLELGRGQKIIYSIKGISTKPIAQLANKKVQFKIIPGRFPKTGIPEKNEPEPSVLEPEEEEFLVKFKDAKEINSPISEFIFKNAVKQFGAKRVEEILNEQNKQIDKKTE